MSSATLSAPEAPVARAGAAGLGLILTACCLGQFMFVLDVAALNVALPVIMADLGFDQASLQWVVSAYAVVLTGFLLLGGRVVDLYGQRRVFLAGIVAFTVASLAGAIAWDGLSLVVARGLQGLGAAFMVPATLAVLGATFTEPRQRVRAFGLWSAVAGGGASVGVLVGGALTELASWRWNLLVNVALGVVLLVLAARVVRDQQVDRVPGARLDLAGALSVTLGLMALVSGVSQIGSAGWSSPRVWGALLVAAALLGFFVVDQAVLAKQPLVPLSIFRNRSVSAANFVTILANGALGSMFYFIAMLLQQVIGFSPMQTGLSYLPLSLGIFVGAAGIAPFVPRFGPRPIMVAGFGIAAVGMLWLAQAEPGTTFVGGLLGPLLLIGFGEGLALTSSTTAATASVRAAQQGLASGLLNTTRQLGGAVGLVVLVAFATSAMIASGIAGSSQTQVLADGYSVAFVVSAVFLLAAAVTAFAVPRVASSRDVSVAEVAGTGVARETVGATR